MFLNHRQYYRCPLAAGETGAELVLGRRKVVCRLIEISLGGFGIAVAHPLLEAESQLAVLKVQGLEYVVRVIRQEIRKDDVMVALEMLEEVLPANSMSPLAKLATWTAWMAALGLVAAAIYSMTIAETRFALSLKSAPVDERSAETA